MQENLTINSKKHTMAKVIKIYLLFSQLTFELIPYEKQPDVLFLRVINRISTTVFIIVIIYAKLYIRLEASLVSLLLNFRRKSCMKEVCGIVENEILH